MMRYPSYKGPFSVRAVKIARVVSATGCLVPDETSLLPIYVSEQWFDRNSPVDGGYYLVLANGTTGYMEAELFENEFTPDH